MAVSIKFGRPTQAERDSHELKATLDPGSSTHQSEILVYLDGLEPAKKYTIKVVIKAKPASDGSDDDGPEKETITAKQLELSPVPELPPADPRD